MSQKLEAYDGEKKIFENTLRKLQYENKIKWGYTYAPYTRGLGPTLPPVTFNIVDTNDAVHFIIFSKIKDSFVSVKSFREDQRYLFSVLPNLWILNIFIKPGRAARHKDYYEDWLLFRANHFKATPTERLNRAELLKLSKGAAVQVYRIVSKTYRDITGIERKLGMTSQGNLSDGLVDIPILKNAKQKT